MKRKGPIIVGRACVSDSLVRKGNLLNYRRGQCEITIPGNSLVGPDRMDMKKTVVS